MLRFTDPGYLILLVPLGVGLVLSWRRVHGIAVGRKRVAFGIRFVLAALLVGALAGPEARRPNVGLATIFLLDRSDSISQADQKRGEQFVDAALRQIGAQDAGGVIVFGKTAVIEANPTGARPLGKVLSRVDGSASDLAGAIRLASASFPEGKARRIVLLSDGNETSGDLAEAAQVAATDGIPLDVVPFGAERRDGEAAVVGLEIPNESRSAQPFDMRVVIDASGEQSGTLDIDRDGVLVKSVGVNLVPGKNSIVVPDQLKDVGFHRYRATLRTSRDRDVRNNVGMGYITVRGRPRVLVLQQDPSKRSLADGLRRSGVDVDLGGPATIPSRAEEIQRYDAVFLNDINASNFSDRQMKLLQTAVRDSGVGLAMIGGENSFLPGGWYGTSIAEALPVDLNIRQRKSFPSTSICIIIDASGSMGMMEDGFQKIRLAAMAAEKTVELMSPMDRVGVAGSSDGIEFVAPMQKLDDKSRVIDQVRKLGLGGGGIYIGPTVAKADEILRKESTSVRHFILLADGNDSTDPRDAIARTVAMRGDKITTSVVAIGDGSDVPLLRSVAAAGGGRFYLAKRAGQLPAIFTQDTALMSRSAIEEGAFIPKLVVGEEILRGVESEGVPPLLAYCLTDRRPLSKIGMRTGKDDPLLATWQYGLGTSLAFMSDAQPRWAKPWMTWSGFSTFWAQASRAIARRATLNKYEVAVKEDAGKGRVELSAFDSLGNPISSSDATVRVALPSGDFREVSLSQEAPGKFTGSFDAGEIGTYIVTVAEKDGAGGTRMNSTGYSLAYPAEYRSYRPNLPLLKRSAETTGGRTLTDPKESLRPAKESGVSIQELWSSLVFLALLLLPLDIAVRRIALPISEMFAKTRARLRRKETSLTTTQQVVVERLQRAKSPSADATTPSQNPVDPPVSVPAQNVARPSVSTGATAKDLLEKKRRRGP